ncbi:hypothetical protein [Bartonella sp. OT172YNZD]
MDLYVVRVFCHVGLLSGMECGARIGGCGRDCDGGGMMVRL